MKKALILFVLAVTAAAASAEPTVSDVTIQQDARRRIRVTYSLSEAAIVTAEFFADGEALGDGPLRTGLSGDVFTPVAAGARSFSWNARKAWPDHTASSFSVRLTPVALTAAPKWMVIDLQNGGTRYYARDSQLLGGSPSNAAYKTTHVLLRRIPAAGVPWRMGGLFALASQSRQGARWKNPHLVTLSEDFYCAVYELTQAQASRFHSLPTQTWTGDLLPAQNLSYEALRGATDDANWPKDGHAVADGSLLKTLRGLCGQDVDLLTEAQWHFACGDAEDPRRVAGGGWTVGTGADGKTEVGTGPERMAEMGWTSENSGARVHEVGGKRANVYGLYDMNGNGGELVLDWCETVLSPESVIDPVGTTSVSVTSGTATIAKFDGSGTEKVGRCYCGGTAQTRWYYAISAYRNWWTATQTHGEFSGVRLGAPGTVRAVK